MGRVAIKQEQHCPETNKLCFATEELAIQRGRVMQRGDPKKRERYVYECEWCGFWHMTTYREYRPLIDDGSAPRVGA